MPDTVLAANSLGSAPDSGSQRPNWDIAKTLYLQDLPHSEIARLCNTSVSSIRCKAWRERWAEEKLTPDAEPKAPSFQDLVTQFNFNMALSVVSATRYYANLDAHIESGRDAKDWETARETLIRSGRMLFGLDQQNNARPSAWATGAAVGPVIDVTPVIQDKPVI
jgi:hypothetical protein